MTDSPEHETVPVHPRTSPLSRWVTALSFGFNNAFSTPAAFAISCVACALWVMLIPVEGFDRWDLTAGLVGNDFESTIEFFFGIATLIVAVAVAKKQHAQESVAHTQTDAQAETLERLAAQSAHISEVDDRLAEALAANTALTAEVHELTKAVHAVIVPSGTAG